MPLFANKVEPETVRRTIITLMQEGKNVRLYVTDAATNASWNLGHFEEDASGALHFIRARFIGENSARPKVALDGDRIKVL